MKREENAFVSQCDQSHGHETTALGHALCHVRCHVMKQKGLVVLRLNLRLCLSLLAIPGLQVVCRQTTQQSPVACMLASAQSVSEGERVADKAELPRFCCAKMRGQRQREAVRESQSERRTEKVCEVTKQGCVRGRGVRERTREREGLAGVVECARVAKGCAHTATKTTPSVKVTERERVRQSERDCVWV